MPNPFNAFIKAPKKNLSLKPDVKVPEDVYVEQDIILGHKVDESTGEVAIFPKIRRDEIPVAEFVKQSENECGLKNVLKKFMKTGDLSLFNQRQVLTNIDVTNLPTKSPEEIYKELDPELTQGKTFEEFLKSLTVEQLEAFYKSKMIKETSVQTEMKGDAQ